MFNWSAIFIIMLKTKKIAYVLSAALTLSILILPATLTTTAKEQTIDLAPKIYEFGEKSEYEIDSKEPTASPEVTTRLGKFSLSGDISQTYTKEGFTAYEIADDTTFSLHYTYRDIRQIASMLLIMPKKQMILRGSRNTSTAVRLILVSTLWVWLAVTMKKQISLIIVESLDKTMSSSCFCRLYTSFIYDFFF